MQTGTWASDAAAPRADAPTVAAASSAAASSPAASSAAGRAAPGPAAAEPSVAGPAAAEPSATPAELARLVSTVAEVERLQAEAVMLAARLAGAGVAERTAGLPLDLLLACEAGLTGGDRHMLITAGQVLETMPHLAAAHRAGQVSWGQVRAVVRMVRRRSLADRAVIDARIEATLEGQSGVERWDPDAFVAAVEAAVDELMSRRALEQREQRAQAANRLWAQPGFDGRVYGGFEYDQSSAATVLNAIAARQGTPAADDPDRPPEIPTPQQRSAAEALVEICEESLGGGGGGGGGGGRARPAYVVDVSVSEVEGSTPGKLRLRLPGAPPRVSGRRIAADAAAGADVRVVITDGAAPLAVSAPVRTDAAGLDRDEAAGQVRLLRVPAPTKPGVAALLSAVNAALSQPALAAALLGGERPLVDPGLLDAEDIPTATRIAVAARDGGCRFYGCNAPVDWSDVHHLDERASGGRHHPDRLVLLCRPDHKRTHDHGWRLHLDPKTGILTGRRGRRTWQTLPRGAPLPRAPDAPRGPARVGPAGPGDSRPPPPRAARPPNDLPF